ncbi:MAG TPA: nucleotidyltransferase family protein [Casimicrobiaceae bacterium]|nr:nucleotidyltransferase family protein [Casimicrobiaceae bacterium]
MSERVPAREALPAHVRPLADALVDPSSATSLDLATWDVVVRVARAAQLLGTLAARLDAAGLASRCPAPVRDHLRGALLEARFLRHAATLEIARAARVLDDAGIPFVLLKGASYIAADLPVAAGRMLRDVDLIVPRARIDEAEALLTATGWEAETSLDAYDQHYYRSWSHQIPPLRREGSPLELDVHHALLPVTGRMHPDAAAVMRDARSSVSGFPVPDPADQVVHAAVHLFQDSDCTSRLRDVADVDALCRHFVRTEPRFAARLAQRAAHHGAMQPVACALAFACGWLGTPIERTAFDDALRASAWVVRHAQLSLPPPHPDRGRTAAERAAARRMVARALWLRMPPSLLAYHGAMKAWRSIVPRRAGAAAAPP